MKARTTLALLFVGLALVVAGRKSSGTSGSGTTYTKGFGSSGIQARVTYNHFAVHETARDVLEKEFLYTITLERVDGRNGVIQATTAREKNVKVESQREGDNLTLVKISVAGDEGAPVDILNRLEMQLKESGGEAGQDRNK